MRLDIAIATTFDGCNSLMMSEGIIKSIQVSILMKKVIAWVQKAIYTFLILEAISITGINMCR